MPVRIRRAFPERPLTGRDYPGGTLYASLDWDGPPRPGAIRFTDRPNDLLPPGQRDFRVCLLLAEEGGRVVGLALLSSEPEVLYLVRVQATGEALWALLRHAVAEAGERPLLGHARDTAANRVVLRSAGLRVRAAAAGSPECLFYTGLSSQVGAVLSEGGGG
jgi:hypothetical protein